MVSRKMGSSAPSLDVQQCISKETRFQSFSRHRIDMLVEHSGHEQRRRLRKEEIKL
jgi:hypothetical protein